ncbi:MAG: formylglycine-generating enzyme family protein [Akkermansiaceae bacterium]
MKSLRNVLVCCALLLIPVSGDEEKVSKLSPDSKDRLMKEMVWVEGGTFLMGSDSDSAAAIEKPAHKVKLDGFYIGKYEVSQKLFEEVMGWDVSYFPDKGYAVNNISWWNIQLFLERLNKITGKRFRLPTEAEWEYAAKGGQKSKGYRFSGSNKIDEVAWHAKNSKQRPHPSGKKKPNELGLYDMTGNLWEYCHDDAVMQPYRAAERSNPVNGSFRKPFSDKPKITRGGGYEFDADESYVFRRDGATPNVRLPDLGFRLVLIGKEPSGK